jgi:hypothetical protein
MSELSETQAIGRRRVPRRTFESPIGALVHGKFTIQRSFQVGEGGMMISSADPLSMDELIVVSFILPMSGMIIVRGVVRSVVPESAEAPMRYGIEFQTLGFHHKREVRNFVAAATRLEGHSGR